MSLLLTHAYTYVTNIILCTNLTVVNVSCVLEYVKPLQQLASEIEVEIRNFLLTNILKFEICTSGMQSHREAKYKFGSWHLHLLLSSQLD